MLGLAVALTLTACGPDADAYKPADYEVQDIPTGQNGSVSDNSTTAPPQGLMAIGERYELNCLPQYGVSYADVIYEAPMEKCSCTRLMGIFQNYGDLEFIEPIRSSRHYFLLEALSYDAIYCNWGLAAAYVGPLINSDLVDNVSASVAGINVGADEAFSRDKERQALG